VQSGTTSVTRIRLPESGDSAYVWTAPEGGELVAAADLTEIAALIESFHWGDFSDGLNLKAFAPVVFMFFAGLAPAIAFGGLAAALTDGQLGAVEMLAVLWFLKTSSLGILFPLPIALLVPVRFLLDRFFDAHHLSHLDGEEEPEQERDMALGP